MYDHAEAALDPGLSIIDTHHQTIFVECLDHYRTSGSKHMMPVGEVEWVMTQVTDDDWAPHLHVFKRATAELATEDRAVLFAGTARRV